jgi:Sugar (and other) transporter
MNNSEAFIREYFHRQGKEYTVVEWGTTVSCYGLGGLLGSVCGPKVIGAFVGRKATLLINNIFLLASSYLIATASDWYIQAIGRILVGTYPLHATLAVKDDEMSDGRFLFIMSNATFLKVLWRALPPLSAQLIWRSFRQLRFVVLCQRRINWVSLWVFCYLKFSQHRP